MAILLGVDTGGTYTDAVLVEDQSRVIASAKSLTTKHDLSLGVGRAIAQVLEDSKVPPSDIGLASLSTTLATNALVEGQGGRVALVYVGFREVDLESHGLRDALAGDPALVLTGGHDHSGRETVALDETAFLTWLETLSGVSAFAVASQFATRNPDHERRIADLLQERTGRPVTCSHHLSSQLNGPKRALTAVLNARLVGMIARLIDLTGATLNDLGIKAPLMVVRGDGALISAVQAQEKPIETILSGPAASLVGARWLTGAETAIVSDIGGTTTDIALLRDGKPALDPAGARVGPWRTMVEAVAMRTTGLGGDSEVHVIDEGLTGGLYLGPRRVVPISLLATEAPDIVHDALDQQVRSETRGEHDARFVRAVQGLDTDGLASKDGALLERIGPDVQPLGSVLRSRLDGSALQRLLRRGLVQVSGVTPSDASHVLGWLQDWDVDAALKALTLMSRMSFGDGSRVSADAGVLAQNIVNQLTEQTSLAVLETVFAEEEAAFDPAPGLLARHILMRRALDGYCGLLRLEAGLEVPLIGLGASAPTYYPAVGKRLCAEMRLPEHAGVANAIGAVAGLVTFQRTGTVTSPSDGCFRVHFNTGPQDFRDENDALQSLETVLEHETRAEAERAGASDIKLSVSRDFRKATIESQDVFIEATVRVEASGRPRITHAGG